ncbi:MAG: hypothetical protein RMJ36_04425 [Candidatus Calescibacterium sp.]|nr:hypothetical protein [Candidatus Calescibacterium sp.]MDW8132881.1 hypothetical protein [Candidatus Calescibacterium sp.]
MISKNTYIEMKVFDLFSVFYYRAQKINAQVNFSTTTLTMNKDGKYLSASFMQVEQNIVNRKSIGYVDLKAPGINIKMYLTEDFEWVINIDNRMIKKVTSTEVDYIFYKVYGYL